MNSQKDYFKILWEKLPKKIKTCIHNIYNTPLFMFTSLAILVCVIVLGIAFVSHEQKETDNPIATLSGERSHVLDSEVAAMYDSLNQVIIDRTNSSPQVIAGEDTANQLTESGAYVSTITDTTTSTGAPSDRTDKTGSISSGLYEDIVIPTTPVYEREYNFVDGYQPTPAPSKNPQYIYPTEAPAATTINCTFPYGTDVTQSEILVEVHAADDMGNSVAPNRMKVLLNNVPVEARYIHNNGAVTYALTLSPGVNHLLVQAPNSVGVISQLEQVFNYTPPTMPVITISVEATTVGFGYLIPPTQVALANQPLSYYVANLLTQNGYEYVNTGTIENSFYITAIGKKHAFANPSIPKDLVETMEKDVTDPSLFQSYNPNNFSADYLTEFNFTSKSGWLYTVNNQNLNLGMSLVLPNANDSIRLRYSLANGKDIGTFIYSDGTSGSYPKQW